MLFPVRQLQLKAAWHARRLRLTAAGGALLAIAGAFLTAALWMAIRSELGPIRASLVVGAMFMLAGAVALHLRRSRPEPAMPSSSQQFHRASDAGAVSGLRDVFPPIMAAFLFGATTYLKLSARTRR